MEPIKKPRRTRDIYAFTSSEDEETKLSAGQDPAVANSATQIADSDAEDSLPAEEMQPPASEHSAAEDGAAGVNAPAADPTENREASAERESPPPRTQKRRRVARPSAGGIPAAADGAAGASASAADQLEHREASAERESPPPRARKQRRAARSPSPSPEPDALIVRDGSLRVTGAPVEWSTSLDNFVKQTPELVKQTQRWLTENRPPIKRGLAEVREILPQLPTGPDWTEEQAETVSTEWDDDLTRERLLDVDGNKDLLTLYKS